MIPKERKGNTWGETHDDPSYLPGDISGLWGSELKSRHNKSKVEERILQEEETAQRSPAEHSGPRAEEHISLSNWNRWGKAQEKRELCRGEVPLWKSAENPCLRSGLHVYKEEESYQRTAKELRMEQTARRQTVLKGNGTPRSSGPVRVVKPHGLLLQYLINTLGIYLRNLRQSPRNKDHI